MLPAVPTENHSSSVEKRELHKQFHGYDGA